LCWLFDGLDHLYQDIRSTLETLKAESRRYLKSLLRLVGFAPKASELYNDVSEQFVIPGVNWLSGFHLEDRPDEAIDKRVAELER
jgi:hypothetical protein